MRRGNSLSRGIRRFLSNRVLNGCARGGSAARLLMSVSHTFLATSDVLSARHPYAQPAFTGTRRLASSSVSVRSGRTILPGC